MDGPGQPDTRFIREPKTMRLSPLPLIVIGAPLAEIVAFGLVVQWLGFWSAFALLLLTSAIGFLIVRRKGFGLISKLSALAREGRPPAGSIGRDLLTLLSGLLLLAPGFLTDIAGFVLLLPFVRDRLSQTASVQTRVYTGDSYTESFEFSGTGRPAAGDGIVDLDETDYHCTGDGGSAAKPGAGELPGR